MFEQRPVRWKIVQAVLFKGLLMEFSVFQKELLGEKSTGNNRCLEYQHRVAASFSRLIPFPWSPAKPYKAFKKMAWAVW